MKGVLRKMKFENEGGEYQVKPSYYIELEEGMLKMNDLVGQSIGLRYQHEIYCISCGKKIKKSYGQGFCYPCFIKVPEAEECVLRPELCRAHEGIARDIKFAEENCLVDHFVYLAWTGGLKVGVTRYHQIPTRWVDQGATYAIKICKTPNRYSAGIIEEELKAILSDKTAWQRMLKDREEVPKDFLAEKAKALEFLNGKGFDYRPEEDIVYTITYPKVETLQKIKSLNLDKVDFIEEKLIGIKGQYLIFESGTVFNVRNHTGYLVEFSV
ncbi:DUF2797 domain-containing protein [Tenuifilum thalassicum]|uniref:DUF2797 domain-containing protein n=1 Tax=Tenuifilum thalassicum TaxID=2590900 RepID=A0A7D4AYI8_9BACT|nr:DUF2797 domain-containing protein [Tenuifilum thalassicum]QKG80914.1 DUF2797 domain-containing protein [Tenuifilum thalassicum]